MTTRAAVTLEPPSQVQIGPFTWRIDFVDEINEGRRYGDTNEMQLRIRVATNVPLQQQQDTLVHELLHAIIVTSGASATWKNADDLDEIVVATCSSLLWQVIRDHPDVCAWLRT